MRNVGLLLAVGFLCATGCSGPILGLSQREAISRASNKLGISFPDRQMSIQTQIEAGGPVAHKIPVTLQTSARELSGDTFLIVFTETWSYEGQRESSHQWSYQVTPREVILTSQHGEIPPQLWR